MTTYNNNYNTNYGPPASSQNQYGLQYNNMQGKQDYAAAPPPSYTQVQGGGPPPPPPTGYVAYKDPKQHLRDEHRKLMKNPDPSQYNVSTAYARVPPISCNPCRCVFCPPDKYPCHRHHYFMWGYILIGLVIFALLAVIIAARVNYNTTKNYLESTCTTIRYQDQGRTFSCNCGKNCVKEYRCYLLYGYFVLPDGKRSDETPIYAERKDSERHGGMCSYETCTGSEKHLTDYNTKENATYTCYHSSDLDVVILARYTEWGPIGLLIPWPCFTAVLIILLLMFYFCGYKCACPAPSKQRSPPVPQNMVVGKDGYLKYGGVAPVNGGTVVPYPPTQPGVHPYPPTQPGVHPM